ncbi:hypothetical protein HDZ31DRAFT_49210 [Schizophyllum fasciatum]
MASVSSELFSSLKNMRSCAIVDYRLVALDQGQYRRQIEHFEYYWGLQKGDIDLASILNHIRSERPLFGMPTHSPNPLFDSPRRHGLQT